MSLIRVASLKPNLQNKITILIKQARADNFKSGKEALEYHLMGQLLKREKTDMKGFQSLAELLKAENLTDVEFEDITVLSYRYSKDPSKLTDRNTGKILFPSRKPFLAVHAECRIILTGKATSSNLTKNMTKKLEFIWTPSHMFSLPPYSKIVFNMLTADGYDVELTY